MDLSKQRKGELLILGQVWMWGLFPVITTISYSALSPMMSLALGTMFSIFTFAFMVHYGKKWHELKNKSALKDILFMTIFTGIMYYALYYFGLKYTTSGNASLVSLMEVCFSFLFFQVWKKEYLSKEHIFGVILMIAGAIIVLLPKSTGWNKGNFLVLMATAVGPFGNFFQRRAREKVSAGTIMFARSLAAFPAIFILALVFSENVSWEGISRSIWILIVNGILVLGISKILWIEGIHRIPVTKALAIGASAPLFTMLFSYLLLKQSPTIWQLLAFAPMALGLYMLTRENKEVEILP